MARRITLLLAAAAALSGCAPSAQSIKPALVSQNAYAGMDCASLDKALAADRAELAAKSAHQDRISSNDPVNIVFFELKIANALDKRNEKRVAELKGQIQAIEAQRTSKSCDAPAPAVQ